MFRKYGERRKKAEVSRRTQPAQRGRIPGVVGGQAAMIGLVHHQQLEPARAILLVHFDTKLMRRPPFGEFALADLRPLMQDSQDTKLDIIRRFSGH